MFKVGDKVRLTDYRDPANYWSDDMEEMAASGQSFLVEEVYIGKLPGVRLDGWNFLDSEVELVQAMEAIGSLENDLVMLKRQLRDIFNF